MDAWLTIPHAAATWFMVGLIWFVQVVHYPLLGALPKSEHVRRTTAVVVPPMLIELGTGVCLALVRPGVLAWSGLALLGVVWGCTALVQVPLHRRLLEGGGEAAVRRLVRSNVVRTLAWSARGVLALCLVAA